MNLPKTHTFNGRRYHLIFDKCDGFCDTNNRYFIIIERDLTKRVGLETVIHEALHACNWHKDEDNVTQTAHDIARFLWNLGYRIKNGS